MAVQKDINKIDKRFVYASSKFTTDPRNHIGQQVKHEVACRINWHAILGPVQ